MENNKRKLVIILIVAILIVTAGVFGAIFRKQLVQKVSDLRRGAAEQVNNLFRDKTEPAEEVLTRLATPQCDFIGDSEAFKAASEKSDPTICGCVKNENVRQNCESSVLEAMRFMQAQKQFDPKLCVLLTSPEVKKNCLESVSNGVAKLSQEDPGYLGNVYLSSGNYVEASKLYGTAVKSDGNNVDYLLNLALALANQALDEHREKELVPQALAYVEKAIQLKADNPEAYRVQGYIYEVKPDYDASISSYFKALEIDNQYIPAYVGRGHAYNMVSSIGKALDDFQKAKELDGGKRKYPEIYYQLCRLESQGPPVDDAVENCLISVQLSSGLVRAEVHGILAGLYVNMGEIGAAESQLKMAQVYAPNAVNTYLTAAQVYFAKADLASARDYANRALAKDATRSSAYYWLAQVQLAENKTAEAITNGLKGLDLVDVDVAVLRPDKAMAKSRFYGVLAEAYGRKGDTANQQKYEGLKKNIATDEDAG